MRGCTSAIDDKGEIGGGAAERSRISSDDEKVESNQASLETKCCSKV